MMRDYEELVERLRAHNGWALNETLDEAADAIEELRDAQERWTQRRWHKMTAEEYRQKLMDIFKETDETQYIALMVEPTEEGFSQLKWLLEYNKRNY